MKNKKYYINVYNKKYDEILKELINEGVSDPYNEATITIDEIATTDIIIGYYLIYYGKEAYKTWNENTKNKNLSKDQKKVAKILKKLCFKN